MADEENAHCHSNMLIEGGWKNWKCSCHYLDHSDFNFFPFKLIYHISNVFSYSINPSGRHIKNITHPP